MYVLMLRMMILMFVLFVVLVRVIVVSKEVFACEVSL